MCGGPSRKAMIWFDEAAVVSPFEGSIFRTDVIVVGLVENTAVSRETAATSQCRTTFQNCSPSVSRPRDSRSECRSWRK